MSILSRIMLGALPMSGIATPALAATLDPLQNIIDEIVTFITGPGGIALGTIVIAAAGLGAAMGRVEWRAFFMSFVGLVMVFGAATIVDGIVATSGGGGSTPPVTTPVSP